MIVVFLTLADAEPMLNLLRQRGFVNAAQQIDAQIAPERLLPSDVLPSLTVKFGDLGFDVFDQVRADAMWDAIGIALRQPVIEQPRPDRSRRPVGVRFGT